MTAWFQRRWRYASQMAYSFLSKQRLLILFLIIVSLSVLLSTTMSMFRHAVCTSQPHSIHTSRGIVIVMTVSIFLPFPTQRRFAGTGTRLPEEIQSFTLSRGTVGRKVFNKGWAHLEPRYPINIQERFHRSAVERIFHPNIVELVYGDDLINYGNTGNTLRIYGYICIF